MQKPLATVVIGGLITATLLTLVVLPAFASRAFGPARQDAVNMSLWWWADEPAFGGWVQDSGIDAKTFGKQMRASGITSAIVTDIARDGMLQGVDANAMADFARATDLRVIASGGVASLDDIRNLLRIEAIGIEGVIVGQALYTNAFTLPNALNLITPETERRHKPRYCEG